MIEYIILAGLIILIILVIISISKNVNEAKITERLGKLETTTVKELSNFQLELLKTMNEEFDKTNEMLEYRLTIMNEKVNERLDQNFNKTNKTFTSILERLSKIDEAQKKIDNLSTDIVSLQSILTDKKTRGIFGEVNLNHILVSIFGENNNRIYQTQYAFPNNTIADAVIFAPKPLGTIAIDSKFPLENYRIMVDKNKSKLDRDLAEKQFKIDVKKHIDAISSKYIIPGITSSQAIMFLPSVLPSMFVMATFLPFANDVRDGSITSKYSLSFSKRVSTLRQNITSSYPSTYATMRLRAPDGFIREAAPI